MTFEDLDIDLEIKEEAARWVVRLSSPKCRPGDRDDLEGWLRADPRHRAAFDRQLRGEEFVERHRADPLIQALAEEVREETSQRWGGRHLARYAAAAAACLGLVVSVSVFLNKPDPNRALGVQSVASVQRYETAIGELSTVTLPDGTELILNTNSKAEVEYSADERRVTLLRGQALFEVAKEIDRPFVVRAGEQRVVALGTSFDVRLDDSLGVQVTLLEGRVSVDDSESAAASSIEAKGNESLARFDLSPGDRFVARPNAAAQVIQADIEEAASWRSGRLVFRQVPLSDVIAEMNRYSVQQLTLDQDARLSTIQVSGVFNTGRISGFVYALETMHPLKAERIGHQQIKLVWQD